MNNKLKLPQRLATMVLWVFVWITMPSVARIFMGVGVYEESSQTQAQMDSAVNILSAIGRVFLAIAILGLIVNTLSMLLRKRNSIKENANDQKARSSLAQVQQHDHQSRHFGFLCYLIYLYRDVSEKHVCDFPLPLSDNSFIENYEVCQRTVSSFSEERKETYDDYIVYQLESNRKSMTMLFDEVIKDDIAPKRLENGDIVTTSSNVRGTDFVEEIIRME